jgi:hypothetical protein
MFDFLACNTACKHDKAFLLRHKFLLNMSYIHSLTKYYFTGVPFKYRMFHEELATCMLCIFTYTTHSVLHV